MKKQIVILILSVVFVNCGFLQAGTPNWLDADIYPSGKVDMVDFAIFAAAWHSDDSPTGNWNPNCDISAPNDGVVDELDLALLSRYWLVNTIDPNEFGFIPAGTFEMGDHHDGWAVSLPVHTVILDSFYISKYEITNRQYCDYLNSEMLAGDIKNPNLNSDIVYAADDISNSFPYCDTSISSSYSQINYSANVFSVNIKDGTTNMSNHPMVMVSWYGAVAYCNWKSQQQGLESCYDLSTWDCDFTKNGFRLATEAEWEYAARGGEYSPYYRYPWGDTMDASMANYWLTGDPYETGLWPHTAPVGYYDGNQTPAGTDMANGYGLYDMMGNVFEWCNDWYDPIYYSSSVTNNPTGPASGSSRILRGGAWGDDGTFSKAAKRYAHFPYSTGKIYGFRICVFASH